MPLPYRKTPGPAGSSAAFLEIVWLPGDHSFYGALLLVDGRGQPLEFVHNVLAAPSGFLWPEAQVRTVAVAALSHSLFEACQREPYLLACSESLGDPVFCKSEIAPSVPFAQITPARDGQPESWAWINDPPPPGSGAHSLAEALRSRGVTTEPFSRIRLGLRELYPDAPWRGGKDDTG